MNEPSNPLEKMLVRAGNGDERAVNELFEHHRPYLRLLAQQSLDSGIGVRADESDLVQQTLLSAFKNFKGFQGKNPGQFIAWLQTIHERNVVDVIRTHTAQKRDHTRESPLADGPELDQGKLPNRVETPSAQAMRIEAVVQLARALEGLPEDQYTAVRLRHLEGWPVERIAEKMDRSEEAVAGLVKRGMKKLKQRLRAESRE